jgi:hypothetical protein
MRGQGLKRLGGRLADALVATQVAAVTELAVAHGALVRELTRVNAGVTARQAVSTRAYRDTHPRGHTRTW